LCTVLFHVYLICIRHCLTIFPSSTLFRSNRAKLSDPIAHFLDRVDAIVQKKDLPLPLQLAINGVANNSLVITTNDGFDRKPILRDRKSTRLKSSSVGISYAVFVLS